VFRTAAVPEGDNLSRRRFFCWRRFELQACLNTPPQGVVDDPKVRDILGQVGVGTCVATERLAGHRILSIEASAPHNAADIQLVAEQSVATFGPAEDGCIVPPTTTRTGDALRVERLRNLAGAGAGRVILKDAAHDHRSILVDGPQAAVEIPVIGQFAHHAIAVGRTACETAGINAPLQATPRFCCEVFEI
jgi:hypothetical protein